MKSVVMIYGFPPEGSAGVYRPLRFVRHLPSFGWHPTVITVDAKSYETYDSSLSNAYSRGSSLPSKKTGDKQRGTQS